MSAAPAEGVTWLPTCPPWCDRRHLDRDQAQRPGDFVVHRMSVGSDEAGGWRVEVNACEELPGVYSEHMVLVETRGQVELTNLDDAARFAYALTQAAVRAAQLAGQR